MSAKNKPRTAIVVGSGCSLRLDVPVMAGFLDKLLDRLSAAKIPYTGARSDLALIRNFISKAKGSAAYVRADLLNIEEMYGIADMAEDLAVKKKKEGAKKVKEAFNRAIFNLAKDAGKEFLTEAKNFPEEYKDLEDLKRESQTEEPVHRNLGTRWTNLLAYLCLASFKDRDGRHPLFIQFNWDLALDRALHHWSRLSKTQYSIVKRLPWCDNSKTDGHDYQVWPRVARPHGGINWVDNEKNAVGKNSNKVLSKSCYRVNASRRTENNIWVNPRPVLHTDISMIGGSWAGGQHMAIVPPTWRKQATRIAYEDQWQIIKDGLSDVRRIVFIGYSLPKTDLYFRHFLALALAENSQLPKVYALNPSILEPGDVRDNYIDLFAPLAREGRLYGIKGRFGDPALFDLHRAIALAKPIRPNE